MRQVLARERFATRPQENFFDQRVKTLRPIDQRYPYEVHNKAWQGHYTRCVKDSVSFCVLLSSRGIRGRTHQAAAQRPGERIRGLRH